MSLEILREGSRGKAVERWQLFLIGQSCLKGVADGLFGPQTTAATRRFQRQHHLVSDGIAGPRTLGLALGLGFDPGLEDKVDPPSNPLLTGTSPLKAVSAARRKKLFGEFAYEPSPTPNNPERVLITDGWERANITSVTIPQLKGVPVFGKPGSGRMRFHRKAAEQLKALWAAWEAEGLLALVLSYDGSFAPRFIRGSRTQLSNHAYGSAFDINAYWNPLGSVPALLGEKGAVREMVELANSFGFYWGGHFSRRPDGMHFEVAELL